VNLKACIVYLDAMYRGNDVANTRWKASTARCSIQKDSTSCGVLALEHARRLLIGESLVNINTSRAGILRLRQRMTKELMAGGLTGVEQVAIPLAEESPMQNLSPTAQIASNAAQTPSPGAQSTPIAAQIVSSALQTPSAAAQSPSMAVQTPSPSARSPPMAAKTPSPTAQIASSVVQTPSPGAWSPFIAAQTPSPGAQTLSPTAHIASSAAQTPSAGAQSPLIAAQITSSAAPTPPAGAQTPLIAAQTPSAGTQSSLIAAHIVSSAAQTPSPSAQSPIMAAQTPSEASAFVATPTSCDPTETPVVGHHVGTPRWEHEELESIQKVLVPETPRSSQLTRFLLCRTRKRDPHPSNSPRR